MRCRLHAASTFHTWPDGYNLCTDVGSLATSSLQQTWLPGHRDWKAWVRVKMAQLSQEAPRSIVGFFWIQPPLPQWHHTASAPILWRSYPVFLCLQSLLRGKLKWHPRPPNKVPSPRVLLMRTTYRLWHSKWPVVSLSSGLAKPGLSES